MRNNGSTQVLAKQHLKYFENYLSKLNVKIRFLLAKQKIKVKS